MESKSPKEIQVEEKITDLVTKSFFQVEEVLIPKIQSSPAKSLLELAKSYIYQKDFVSLSPDYKTKTIMIGTATPRISPDTFTLTVPKADVSLFKSIAKKMGWKIERKRTAKPRLYDPESGDYLNDATMKVIEDARKGKDVIEVGSMDEYLELVKNL